MGGNRFLKFLGRGLTLRCLNCGSFTMVRGIVSIHRHCRVCGFDFGHDENSFLGALVFNYTFTALIGIVPPLVMVATSRWSVTTAIIYAVVVCLLFPVLFYWHSRSLWMALYYYSVPDAFRVAQRHVEDDGDEELTGLSPEQRAERYAREALAELEGADFDARRTR